jgi:hypothetical protein
LPRGLEKMEQELDVEYSFVLAKRIEEDATGTG